MKNSHALDLLIVNSPGKRKVYQSLANDLAAFEPPIWAGLIANFIRGKGFSVAILDAEALNLTESETAQRICDAHPVLAVFAVYGQQPSASTQCMPAASEVHGLVKNRDSGIKTLFLGTHPSALAERTLREEHADFVCEGEGPYTVLGALERIKAGGTDFTGIGGLWHRQGAQIVSNGKSGNIENLDAELPGMAWDLLPMERYKAHNWHCWDHINARQPYASLYTSLGCPYKCSFCCINAPFGGSGIRFFSPEWVIKEIDILVTRYGVKNIKIADEMFVLHPKHVLGICDLIIERGYDLNIWAYARVDTVKERFLEKLKRAGFNWLGLGVESASKFVRDGVEKGRFGDTDIKAVVDKIRSADINVCANYIFGLPDDTMASMQETLDLALEMNTEYANFYCAMAYPGSALHKQAVEKGQAIPENPGGPGWIGYSQHAKETYNLSTDTLEAGQVLTFRDKAFQTYFTSPEYLAMMERKFGTEVVAHLKSMVAHNLERKYALPI